jgi:L-threonylcarbamoyladenylate synthase
VALPTETVYGLAADALRPDAAVKIFEAKERPFFDPLIVHLPDRSWLERLCAIPQESRALVDATDRALLAGPLTLVLPRTSLVPDVVTSAWRRSRCA